MIIVGSHAIIKPVMKIISWNINALRAHEMVFRNVIQQEKPDIFCLQEIRAREDQLDFRVEGYKSYLNPATLSQYYGTGGLVHQPDILADCLLVHTRLMADLAV